VINTIGGVRCYVATPETEYPKDKILLFLTDVFGVDRVNSQVRIFSSSSNSPNENDLALGG
jgi:hypothetical protein